MSTKKHPRDLSDDEADAIVAAFDRIDDSAKVVAGPEARQRFRGMDEG